MPRWVSLAWCVVFLCFLIWVMPAKEEGLVIDDTGLGRTREVNRVMATHRVVRHIGRCASAGNVLRMRAIMTT